MGKKNQPTETDYPTPAKPASLAALDGYRRLALGVVLQAVEDAREDPDPGKSYNALAWLADPYGGALWLDCLDQPGANDPRRLCLAALKGGNNGRHKHKRS